MKYVLFYGGAMSAGHNEAPGREAPEDLGRKIADLMPEHRARLDQFHAEGRLLMVGAFADPMSDGSMGIFPTRQDAEDFMLGDPFLKNGVVRSWRLVEWNEVLST